MWELNVFLSLLQQIVLNTESLLNSGTELEQTPYADQETVQSLMGKIKQLVTDFDSRLSKRKKKLDDSVRLHRLTAAVSLSSLLNGCDGLVEWWSLSTCRGFSPGVKCTG